MLAPTAEAVDALAAVPTPAALPVATSWAAASEETAMKATAKMARFFIDSSWLSEKLNECD
ncbi:hypothetical protein GY26_00040 [Gammaproteobacteria bacterium MFB021]|nr:hypothetical protein GY26_00040 [Gammaproteobacteria bacterium MFB021]